MIQWEQVELNDATHVEINGEVHELIEGGKVIKSGKLSIDGKYLCISILIGMYDWMQISQEAFPLLGIRCLRKVKREPIEFVREANENQLSTDFWNKAWIPLPEKAIGKKFRLVEILEDEE
jgi:hypothetical protein